MAQGRAAADAIQKITGRSPGDRTSAILTKAKREAAPERTARALPRQRTGKPGEQPPPAEAAFAPTEPFEAPETDFAGVEPDSPFPLPAPVAGIGPGGFPPPTGIGGIGGGGGGGGEAPGPGGETQPAIPVPEPATWATFILGFGLMGALLRRRVRAARAARA